MSKVKMYKEDRDESEKFTFTPKNGLYECKKVHVSELIFKFYFRGILYEM